MKILYLILVMLMTTESSYACRLPAQQELNIGCTPGCGFSYRLRLTLSAIVQGYKINIKQIHDPAAIDDVDAILIPGGIDIHPKYYWDEVSVELKEYTQKYLHLVKLTERGKVRDPLEYQIVKNYSTDPKFEKMPMLGICRGMQMMAVAQGIPLYLDIKSELGIPNRMNRFDLIKIEQKDSLMDQIYFFDSALGFKLHHQGVRVNYFNSHSYQYPNVELTAFSKDGRIAEALEYKHRPALGVQYHPEKSYTGTAAPIFKWFLTSACEYKTTYKEEL